MSDIIEVSMYSEVQITGESVWCISVYHPRACLEMSVESHNGLSVKKAGVFDSDYVPTDYKF